MKLASFCILTVFALIFAALTVAETAMYQSWDNALAQQKIIQMKVNYLQQQNGVIRELLRRLAVDSQRDPALTELLKQNHINVVIKGGDAAKSSDGEANPAPSNRPASVPSTPTPSHP